MAEQKREKPRDIEYVPEECNEVSCAGGGILGHPRVYYCFDGRTEITCEYCGKIFTHTPPGKIN